jgi:hypothetical protein
VRSGGSGAAALQGTLSVTGHVGVGTATPENAEGWGRVVDVLGDAHAKLAVRTNGGKIDGRVMAHDGNIYGTVPGMLAGTRSAHPLSLVTNGATRLTVSVGGRVGIGTDPRTEPKHELSVNGRLALENGVIQRGGTAITTTNDLGLYSQIEGQYIRMVTNKAPFRFFTDSGIGATHQFTVEADGDVGIGTVPTARLDVAGVGDKTTQPSLLLRAGNSANRSEAVQLSFSYNGGSQYRHTLRTRHNGGAVSGNALDFYVWTPPDPDGLGFTHTLTMDGGHVGVGTTTPENAEGWGRVLDILGPASAKLSVRTTTGKVDARVLAHDTGFFGSVPGMIVGTRSTHAVGLATNGATRLTVTPEGHIGVGSTAVDNAENWARIVDMYSRFNFRLNLRTDVVESRIMAHEGQFWGGERGMFLGTKTEHFLNLATTGVTRLTVTPDGMVGIGTTRPENRERAAQYVEVFGRASSQLNVRTERTDVFLMALDAALGPMPAGAAIGTRSPLPISLVTGGKPSLQISMENGLNLPENGVISCGATERIGTRDLGLYSQRQGQWLRLVTNAGPIAFFTDGGAGGQPRLSINQSGQVLATGDLFVQGRLCFLWGGEGWKHVQNKAFETAGSYGTSGPAGLSDARLKTAVRPLTDALRSVLRLTGLRYRWDEAGLEHLTRDVADSVSAGPDATEDDHRRVRDAAVARARAGLVGDDIGLLAQDVERVVPEVVHDGPDGYKHIRYAQLTALLVEAVKEQQALIGELRARVAACEAR